MLPLERSSLIKEDLERLLGPASGPLSPVTNANVIGFPIGGEFRGIGLIRIDGPISAVAVIGTPLGDALDVAKTDPHASGVKQAQMRG